MNVSPTLMLIIGLTAAALFLTLFIVAVILTARNRRLIRRHSARHSAR